MINCSVEGSADGSPKPLPKIRVNLHSAWGKLNPPALFLIKVELDGVRNLRGLLFITSWLGVRSFQVVNGSSCWWSLVFYFLSLLFFGHFVWNFCTILRLEPSLFALLLVISLYTLAKNLLGGLPRCFTLRKITLSNSFSVAGIPYVHSNIFKAKSLSCLLFFLFSP
jgi:hypothetical protein